MDKDIEPKISIITIVYNDIKHIKSTLDSVLSQSYKNIEYIIVDGNSKDGTKEFIENYIKQVANINFEHSSLGNHSNNLVDFGSSQTISLASPSKFSKNHESNTANIRMLGGEDSSGMESVESKLDSSAESTLDSTLCVESSNNNPHEAKRSATLKACSGKEGQDDKNVAKGGVGASVASLSRTPFSPFEDRSLENDSLVEDSNKVKDSTNLDSRDSNLATKLYIEAISKANPNFTFKYLSEKDSGIYDAMNKGIELASGEWCNFMNCGDRFYDESAVERLFAAFRAYCLEDKEGGAEISIIYGDSKIIFDDIHFKILRSTTTLHKYRHHFIHQAAFINADVMKSYKYDTSFKIAGDTDFFTRAYNNGVRFKHFSEIIVSFNVEGVSSSLSFLMFKEDCKIGYKYNKFFPIMHTLKYLFWIIPRVCIRNLIPKHLRGKAREIFGKKTN